MKQLSPTPSNEVNKEVQDQEEEDRALSSGGSERSNEDSGSDTHIELAQVTGTYNDQFPDHLAALSEEYSWANVRNDWTVPPLWAKAPIPLPFEPDNHSSIVSEIRET